MSNQKKFLPKLYPVKKEINKTWYIEFIGTDGLRKKVYGRLNHLPTIEQRIIEADFLIKQIAESNQVKPAVSAGNQLLRDLDEVFKIKKPYWSPKTISAYQTHFYSFARWYRQQGCPNLTPLVALRFLNAVSAGNGATTRNNYRNNLKGLFGQLCKLYKNRYTDNPFTDAGLIPETRKTKDWYRPVQVQEIKTALQNDWQLLTACRIMYHCFARPNEIRQLRCSDIVTDTQKLRIQSNISKTKRTRYVPVPDCLMNDLKRLAALPGHYFIFGVGGLPGPEKLSRDNLSKRHKEVLQQLNYPDGFTFYSWKNTGAVKMLLQDRRNLRYISKCMGHHSLDMTDNYFESLGVDETGSTIIFPEM